MCDIEDSSTTQPTMAFNKRMYINKLIITIDVTYIQLIYLLLTLTASAETKMKYPFVSIFILLHWQVAGALMAF